MAAAAQSANDAVGGLGQCHWTGSTGWRASTSLTRDMVRFRGTGYLTSSRVGALPSSTRSTRRDRPVRGKGRSSHIECSFTQSHPQSHGTSFSNRCRKKKTQNRLFHQLKLDARQFPTHSPCAMSFFPSTGTRRAVGRFPRFFPGFWWI